jgi:hypothetical protein
MMILLHLSLSFDKGKRKMTIIERQSEDRRWRIPMDFPLTDGEGTSVSYNRRSDSDRRRAAATLEDLLILFSELPTVDLERKQ